MLILSLNIVMRRQTLDPDNTARYCVYCICCVCMLCPVHTAYRINIGGELYLADWRISCHTANIKSANIAPTAEKAWRSYHATSNCQIYIRQLQFSSIRQTLFPPIYSATRYTLYVSSCVPSPMQATYYLRQDGTFEPRLLGCFQGSFDCTDDKRCILETTAQESIYFCCCIENYCNADETLLFPNVTSVTLTPPPVPHTTDNPTTPTETSTG